MLYIKQTNKKTPKRVDQPPPSAKKKSKRNKRWKKQPKKIKAAIAISFHASWINVLTHHIESTMNKPEFVFFRIRSQICTYEIKVKLISLNKNCYKPEYHILGSYFVILIQIEILVGRHEVWSPVDAVGVTYHRSDQYEGHAWEQTPGNSGMWGGPIQHKPESTINYSTFFSSIHSITIWPFLVLFTEIKIDFGAGFLNSPE